MNLSHQIMQYLFSGLSTGAIYSLIGLGFAIIYNATGIINFAQGEFVMLGGMLTYFFLAVAKMPLFASMALAIIISTIIGIVFERLAIRPLKKPTPLNLVIITIGGSIFIRGVAMLVWGKTPITYRCFPNEPLLAGQPSSSAYVDIRNHVVHNYYQQALLLLQHKRKSHARLFL
jgi:branched-chain amino acid transport system permease protein